MSIKIIIKHSIIIVCLIGVGYAGNQKNKENKQKKQRTELLLHKYQKYEKKRQEVLKEYLKLLNKDILPVQEEMPFR